MDFKDFCQHFIQPLKVLLFMLQVKSLLTKYREPVKKKWAGHVKKVMFGDYKFRNKFTIWS